MGSIIVACWAPTNNVLHESLDAVKSWQGLARAFPVSKMFVGASQLASQTPYTVKNRQGLARVFPVSGTLQRHNFGGLVQVKK